MSEDEAKVLVRGQWLTVSEAARLYGGPERPRTPHSLVPEVKVAAQGRRFIESVRFPFQEVSEASAVEKGLGGMPPYWEMIFWWTRKPLISARAVIAGCLLPEDLSPRNFLRSIGILVCKRRGDGKPVFEKTPHRVKPSFRFDGVRLLDPFACFGSIPLEGLRLGLSVTACDLLPVGYVFLKAVLEYPAKYGMRLVEDVRKFGNWITERLKEDPLIKELYDEDVSVCIGSWEVKCPSCGKWTRLVHNWWLAREEGDKGYKRLAWMEPRTDGDRIAIHVVDLNKVLGDDAVREAEVKGLKVTAGAHQFTVPESNIEPRTEKGICLHCSKPIMKIDPETGKHYIETKTLPKQAKKKLEGYIKFAFKLFNQQVGEGFHRPAWVKETLVRLSPLVNVTARDNDLEFSPCTERDQEDLERAKLELKELLHKRDGDIPTETLAPYGTQAIGGYLQPINYGMTELYKLFNARQLLALAKLAKLIREVGRLVEHEKLREGSSQEDAFKYAEAVTTYLAVAHASLADLNSLVSRWAPHAWKKVCRAFTHRGLAMIWNWCDVNPLATYIGTWNNCVRNITDGLEYLASGLQGSSANVDVLLDDARALSRVSANEHYDLVVTDPPYYYDVPYCELSDFYYVWLKRTMSDMEGGRLKPRFLREAFFENIGGEWTEISTQWEKYALSEVSLNPPRLGSNATMEDGIRHFQNLLDSSFATMVSKLRKEGLLVTYYAHTDPDAWKALLEAGWEAAGLRVTNAFPLATESAQSVVSRGKLSMDTSIIVVWRTGSQGSVDASDLYSEMVEEAARRATELMDLGAIGRDFVVGTLAAALATATKYREVRVMGKIDVGTLVDKYVYPATYLGLTRALARKAELKDGVRSPDAIFYLLVKSMLAGAKKKVLESTDARIFSIGTSLDLDAAVKTWRILRAGEEEAGARVAKAKTLTLVEPASADRSKIAELLEVRGVGVKDPRVRCSVDALHALEYMAVVHPREEFRRKLEELKAKFPAHVEEAVSLARIMAKVLPEEDLERGLCNRIVEHLEPIIPKLDRASYEG